MNNTVNIPMSLLNFLFQIYPTTSRNTVRSWLRQGRVLIDGTPIFTPHAIVQPGQKVSLDRRVQFAEDDVKILFEDRHIVVVEKPAGLLSVGTAYQSYHSVHAILKRRAVGKGVYPVHRLDRDVSGLMVFAYHPAARDRLKSQFVAHTISREYHAVIVGRPPATQGVWKSHLVEGPKYSMRSGTTGKLAVTHYQLVEAGVEFSLIKLRLETGKKHQIRLHCSEAGCPIVGDGRYGEPIQGGRILLHASALNFLHPQDQYPLTFVSLLPFARLLIKFGLTHMPKRS